MCKSKARKYFYCFDCLRKFYNRHLCPGELCPYCNVQTRHVKTQRARASTVTRLRRLRGLEPPKKKEDYYIYLESELWKTIRRRVLEHDKFVCQICRCKATVVHHKSYEHVVLAGLRDEELVSLCHDCHHRIEFTEVDGKEKKNDLKIANKKLLAMQVY